MTTRTNRRAAGAPPSDAPTGGAPGGTAPEPPYRGPSVRAALGLLLVAVVLGGVAYPAAVAGFAALVSPSPDTGAPPGTGDPSAYASELLGQNISNASLFWLRPSLLDWQATMGSGEAPLGPTDPTLVNATLAYLAAYGLNATTAPLDLVSPSASGVDPDVSAAGALIQIPRVAAASGLSQATLTTFVEERIHPPLFGFLGPSYVNVIELDRALLALLAAGG